MMSQKIWKAREVEVLITCREKAAETGGFEAAKFVAAQYNFDGTLLTFLFTAEDKLNYAINCARPCSNAVSRPG